MEGYRVAVAEGERQQWVKTRVAELAEVLQGPSNRRISAPGCFPNLFRGLVVDARLFTCSTKLMGIITFGAFTVGVSQQSTQRDSGPVTASWARPSVSERLWC